MKKIVFSMLAVALMTGFAYADNGKKLSKKKAKTNQCKKSDCCDKSKCTTTCPMPLCCH